MPSAAHVVHLPGAAGHLVVVADEGLTVRTPSGELLRLQNPPYGTLAALTEPTLAGKEVHAYLRALTDELAKRSAVLAERRWPVGRQSVLLVGAGPIVDELAAALRAWGCSVTAAPTLDAALGNPRGVDSRGDAPLLVISYADSARERVAWQFAEAHLREGVAWLRAYREGELCFVDPLSLEEGDAGAEQVTRRRIAASLDPSCMLAWTTIAPGGGHPDPYSRAMTVSRILTVALAWARQDDALKSYRRTLWKLVPHTGVVTEQVVLGHEPPYTPAPLRDSSARP